MPILNGNWVDLIIILIFIYYASEAFRYGFWGIITDFVAFFGSLIISLRIYHFAATFLRSNFNLPPTFDNALGFVLTAVVIEIILNYIVGFIVGLLPKSVRKAKLSQIMGLIPAIGEALIVVAFLLTAIIALPVQPQIKKAVTDSKIGGLILEKTSGIERNINTIFGGAINDALTYFTIEPGSNQTVKLNGGIDKLSYDHVSEAQMFNDLNSQRVKNGVAPLSLDSKISTVAEAYAMDMWKRQYFSHYNPEGQTVVDRFSIAGIPYQIVGENLALAPTEQSAMAGLMNSPGHRANILDSEFHKVGIGVVDNGIYGKIFVQEFTN